MQLRFSKYFTFRESNSSNSRHCMIPMLSALSAFYTVYVTGTAVTPKDPHQCTCIQSSEPWLPSFPIIRSHTHVCVLK